MVVVFQMPTLVFFLAKMQLVTARFLWRHIKYAILIIFIIAAAAHAVDRSVEPDGLCRADGRSLSAQHRNRVARGTEAGESGNRRTTQKLRLVFAAAVIDQAWKHRQRSPGEFPRRM